MATVSAIAVTVLVLAALLILGIGTFVHRRMVELIAIAAALAATVLAAVVLVRSPGMTVHWFGGWEPHGRMPIGIDFAVDRFGAGMALLTAGLGTAALVVSWKYFDDVRPQYYVILLLFLAGALGLCFTGDLFNLFVFFELMSVTGYALAAYKIEDEGALQGTLNFAISTSIGAFAILLGIGLVYGRTGTLSLAQLGQTLAHHRPDGLVVIACTLLLGGLLVKAAVVPFHFWLADAHAVAPTPICVLFSGMMVEVGAYAAARVYWTVFAGTITADALRPCLIVIGTLTAVVGAVLCACQHHLKRLLAFSTIAHSGIIIVGIGVLESKALAGTSIYVLAHGCVKGSLFLCTAALVYRFGAADEQRLHGRGRGMYIVGSCWALGGLALAGLPPFGLYLGKGFIDEALWNRHLGVLVVTLSACAAATGAAVLRAGGHVFLGVGEIADDEASRREGEEEGGDTARDRGRSTPFELVPIVTLVAAALAIGLLPALGRVANNAAARFIDRPAYAASVLGHAAAVARAETIGPTAAAAIAGLATAVGAVVLGAALLFAPKARGVRIRAVASVLGAPVRGLRALHTGRVGDVTAWLVLGLALFGGAVAVTTR